METRSRKNSASESSPGAIDRLLDLPVHHLFSLLLKEVGDLEGVMLYFGLATRSALLR